jgi:HSP20 family protein
MNLLNSHLPACGQASVAQNDPCDQAPRETLEPHYEVKETDDAFGVTVTLPGVAKDGLEITADESTLRIVGRRTWSRPENWTELHRETSDVSYLLELNHENVINTEKVNAVISDGILQISLPKAEAIKPRKIAVT